MQERHEREGFEDNTRGDGVRYFMAWAYVFGYTLRTLWRLVFCVLCLVPWIPIAAILLALALTL